MQAADELGTALKKSALNPRSHALPHGQMVLRRPCGSCSVTVAMLMQGLSLHYARTARPFLVLLRAFLACGLLYPFFRLAQILVYAKVRTNIGIKKAVISGGGSLVASLDDFFEALGLPILNGWGLTEVRVWT